MVQPVEDNDLNDDQPENTLELFAELDQVIGLIEELPNIQVNGFEKQYEIYSEVLGRYQYQPHLLDPHLPVLLEKILQFIRPTAVKPVSSIPPALLQHFAYKYLYQIIKVRNYKVLVNFLPHELSDLEFVLIKLELQDLSDSTHWETRYVLLLWMSILVLNPFHLSRLDAYSAEGPNQLPGATKMERIFKLCEMNTENNDTCAVSVAAYMTAKYMSRMDVCEKYLNRYFSNIISATGTDSNQIRVGQLAAIAHILKHGKRENLLREAPNLLQWITSCDFKACSDYLKYKFYVKIVQRLGMIFLKPRLARWRYQRGSRSLVTNLSQAQPALAGGGGDNDGFKSTVIKEDFDEDIEVVDEIEDIIEELLQGLRSASSTVRWSSAKGIGRITNRLSKSLGDEVVGTVVDMMNPLEPHEAWHGACLGIAELAKRGLLLPYRLTAMVPLLMQALVYDEMKGFMSVGQHIRDSACYMAWAFARAYNPQDLAPFVDQIAAALLITTVFDREINCRRAASAAFQESVGRLGNFPHGIDILTVADFFSVGVRTNSYLEISDFIAQFEEYSVPLIDHLVAKKIIHWDMAIRELAAKALQRLTKRNPKYVAREIIPKLFLLTDSIDINTRHGSVIALGEVTTALMGLENVHDEQEGHLSEETVSQLNGLIAKFFERDQFRGMSGEIMKQGCSDFILNCSQARINTTVKCLESWQVFIDKCIMNKGTQIREGATKAFNAMATAYYNNEDHREMNVKIIEAYLLGCHNDLEEHIRMGYLMAVGAFPIFLYELKLDAIIQTLIKQSLLPNYVQNPNENVITRNWSEARRESVHALTALVQVMGGSGGLSEQQVREIFACLLEALTEYTSDNRGDIGAWVREASMKGLYRLVTLSQPSILDAELMHRIMCGLAQQAVEKIDRTRGLAGKLFCQLVHAGGGSGDGGQVVPNIKRHAELKAIFPENCESVLWLFADHTFPLFCALLRFAEYSETIILGLSASIGQLSESLIKYSSAALFNFLKSHPEDVARIGDEIIAVLSKHMGNERITGPMINFIDLLIRSGTISSLIADTNCSFAEEIFRLINIDIKGHKKLYKLVASINVFCQLIQVPALAPKIFSKVAIFLGLPLVHVRKTTATKFYEALILYGDQTEIAEEHLDDIYNLLTDTDWGQPLTEVRPIRNELCRLIGINPPTAAVATVAK